MRTKCSSASWNVSGWSEIGFAFGILLPVGRTVVGIDRLCLQLADWLCSAEADASVPTSASCYHVEENIRILAIVEAILKFRQIQRQIFFADVVIGADDSALEQRPEPFNRLVDSGFTLSFPGAP